MLYIILKSHPQLYKFSVEYDINSKTTIGFGIQGDLNSRQNSMKGNTVIGTNPSVVDSTIQTDADSKAHFNNINLNLNLRHQFAQKGRGVNFDLDYGLYEATWNEWFTQQFFKNISEIAYKPSQVIWFPWNQKNQIQSIKSDYMHPFKNGTLEIGIQIRNTQMNIDFEYQQKVGNIWQINPLRSFNYDYVETVKAAYFNYNGKKNKLTYQTGLRYEHSLVNVKTWQFNNSSEQNYGNLFPSLSVQYAYNKKQSVTFSYTQRITRPTFTQLNERPIFFNLYRQTIGNAYLKPTLTSSVEIGLNINQQLLFSVGYRINRNDITLVPTLQDNITYYKSQNFNKSSTTFFDVVFAKNLTPWWNTNTGLQYFYVHNDFRNLRELSGSNSRSLYLRTNNVFSLKNGIKLELNGFYYPPFESGAFRVLDLKKIDIGLQKSIFQKKGDLRINITDIFNTLTTRYLFFADGIVGDENVKSESRFIRLSFLYRFGNNYLKVKDKKSGIERENNRIEK
ncbi:MAG: TonB-dependent receptor [Cytophagales bacterium]|nr:MAG: TonB-dependent receptor [Cytophagales bacterium]